MPSPRLNAAKSATRDAESVSISRRAQPTRKRRRIVYEFSFHPGSVLGEDFVVVEGLSAGPFTEIYKVWSESRLCEFACKVLRPSLEHDRPHARALRREAAVLAGLAHPNVVRTFQADPALPLPHVVMEHLPGPSLLDLLAAAPRRRLKVEDALTIAIRIGAALAHLHDRGMIYRDLKPANVIMRDDVPVLVDFGGAYRWKPDRSPRVRVGTDPYMAPEQCLGEALSPRTDVFGLGAVTFEMLTGEWPYEDQLMNVFDRSRIENRWPQLVHRPGPIRRRVPGDGNGLEEVVYRCLARNPKRRYATMGELVFELNRLLAEHDRVVPEPLLKVPGTSGQAA